MIRHIVGSWMFAAFLVVVAVVTWRVLDAGRAPTCPGQQHLAVVAPPPVATPVAEPAPPAPEPVYAHTCGAGGEQLGNDLHDPFEPAAQPAQNEMTDDQAQDAFEDAVTRLRLHETNEGCAVLKNIVNHAPADSRWASKAELLRVHRCVQR